MDSPVDKAFKVVFEIESIGKGKKESQFHSYRLSSLNFDILISSKGELGLL